MNLPCNIITSHHAPCSRNVKTICYSSTCMNSHDTKLIYAFPGKNYELHHHQSCYLSLYLIHELQGVVNFVGHFRHIYCSSTPPIRVTPTQPQSAWRKLYIHSEPQFTWHEVFIHSQPWTKPQCHISGEAMGCASRPTPLALPAPFNSFSVHRTVATLFLETLLQTFTCLAFFADYSC